MAEKDAADCNISPKREAALTSENTKTVSSDLTLPHFINTPTFFRAGNISNHFDTWRQVTSDSNLLNIVKNGYHIEFHSTPTQSHSCIHKVFNDRENSIISAEIDNLLAIQAVNKVEPCSSQFVSPIFLRPKPDGSHRLILNLRDLNAFVENHHFKMETLKTALHLVKPECFFASIDLSQAYYSVPIAICCRKYLRFLWNNDLYEFTCLPFGLSPGPRVFTKLLKPMFSSLRKMGHLNVAYVDDSLLQGDTESQCTTNVTDTAILADSLGFTINPKKSIFQPTQKIVFVGFLICSLTMTVRLTPEKIRDITNLGARLLQQTIITIRLFAKFIGKCVASEPGVRYAPLYYKSLEIERDTLLRLHRGNFDASVEISSKSRECIQWWVDNLVSAFKPITLTNPDRRIESDSSGAGWGCHDVTQNNLCSGQWSTTDRQQHINYLELKAAFLALQHLCKDVRGEHIHLYLDNTTAIKYLSKMGGRKALLNDLARDIWFWCMERDIWLSCFHLPGKLNTTADKLSRKLSDDMEWSLSPEIFSLIEKQYGSFDIDLFASNKNYKLSKYASYVPDKQAFAIDAFSLNWRNFYSYIFCPFSMMGPVLQKLSQSNAEAVIVAPFFATQPWFPLLLKMVCQKSFVLPHPHQILQSPRPGKQHPLPKMRLGVFRVSGKNSFCREYQQTLPTSSSAHGEILRRNNMGHISKNGVHFAIENKLINFVPL